MAAGAALSFDAVVAFQKTLADTYQALEDAAIGLAQVPSYGWISTADHLPPTRERVLVWQPWNDCARFGSFNEIATRGKYGATDWPTDGLIWLIDRMEGPNHVTHWMPIVPPPKEAP